MKRDKPPDSEWPRDPAMIAFIRALARMQARADHAREMEERMAGPDKEELVSFVYTPEEVAERWKCSPAFVRRMFVDGKLPGAFRLGGKLMRIPIDTIEAVEREGLVAGKVKSDAGAKAEQMDSRTSLRDVMRRRRLLTKLTKSDPPAEK